MKRIEQLAIHDTPEGATLAVKVVPGSSRDKIAGVLGEELKISTSAPPEKGKANQAVARILARTFDVSARCVHIQSGMTSPHKTFLICGSKAIDLLARLKSI